MSHEPTVAEKLEQELYRELGSKFLKLAPDAVVVVDARGTIVLVNDQAENLFGYHRTELLGNAVEMLVTDELMLKHAKHREKYMGQAYTRMMGMGKPLTARCKQGREFQVEIMLSPVTVRNHGRLVMATIRRAGEHGFL